MGKHLLVGGKNFFKRIGPVEPNKKLEALHYPEKKLKLLYEKMCQGPPKSTLWQDIWTFAKLRILYRS